MILRREENQRTRRKTLEARERRTTTTLLTWVTRSRINTGLYPGGHPSSYNPVRSRAYVRSSAVKGNALTAHATPASNKHVISNKEVSKRMQEYATRGNYDIIHHTYEIYSTESMHTYISYSWTLLAAQNEITELCNFLMIEIACFVIRSPSLSIHNLTTRGESVVWF